MSAPVTSSPVEPGLSVNNSVNSAKPMTPQELRLECVKQAVALKPPPAQVIDIAKSLYRFVLEGPSDSSGD